MIVRPKPGLLALFFVMRGSVVPRILPHIFGFAAYAAVIVIAVDVASFDMSSFSIAPFGLLGVALSIYMGFRNNAAYDRWWEARKLWGELVYEVRNLARVGNGLIEDRTERRALLMEALAFCHFLRGQLRGVDVIAEARKFIGDEVDAVARAINRPDALVRRMGRRAAALRQKAAIDAIGYRIIDERLATISAVQAGCERIAGTPLPFAYTLLLQRTAHIFCLLLPFGLVSSAGWATPLFTALVAYTFFGLDALSQELEDPFGMEANDLALDAICRVCEISIFEALDEPVPVMPAPERYFYS
ncbi:bestrophin family protein [Pseudaminobacter sp. NGMCC 1.201702]|uniref:bestrophin family protein n=1 Tax=Pseudaminobacter sp. NGMCC 1.201702 TaxID=3391825 RepID=UPI0039F06D51